VAEVEEGKEEVWPERVLPVMSEADGKRLRRQRNVGMCVWSNTRDLELTRHQISTYRLWKDDSD
jgi:hypothetical protein